MARIEESIIIKRPVDKVFAYAIDGKSMPKWQTIITDTEQTSKGSVGVGTTFKWITHAAGLRMKTTAKVVDYELNKKIGMDIDWGSIAGTSYFYVDAVEGGTKFTQRNDMKYSWLLLFSPLLAYFERKHLKVALNNLKSILETQA
jgi:uncharacterized membrane protein